jgi:acetate---CoA ligase (ADP-forming) subunit beta
MKIIDKVQKFLHTETDRGVFHEHKVKGLLRELGMSVPKGVFVPTGAGVSSISGLSYPLAAKVVSSRITSKSDIGGVRLGIENGDELEIAVLELAQLSRAEGVLVEEMAPPGFEVIVGGAIDIAFGPIVMFGLGGLFVELFREVSFALAPVTREQARWLVRETKGEKIMQGFRGKPPLDIDAIVTVIVTISELIATGLFQTIDLNPVALYPSGALVLDAKMSRL